jgi:hypothetical protein
LHGPESWYNYNDEEMMHRLAKAVNELEEFLKTSRILIKQTSDHFTFYGYGPLAGDSSDTAHLNRLMENLKEQAAGQLVQMYQVEQQSLLRVQTARRQAGQPDFVEGDDEDQHSQGAGVGRPIPVLL